MRVTAIDRLLRRQLTALAVVLAMGGAIVAHHLRMDDIGSGGAIVVCLAVLPAVTFAAAPVVGELLPQLSLVLAWPVCQVPTAPPLPRARSSPLATVVLRR